MAFKPISHNTESEGDDSSIISEINITPLTDIFLVLLIIFMVTSSVMSDLGVDVELPSGGKQMSQSQSEGVIVTLLPDGGMKINDARIAPQDWQTFRETVSKLFSVTRSRLIILEGDRKAFLGTAIELMDQARSGADRFAIATQPE